jgi:predicted ATPase
VTALWKDGHLRRLELQPLSRDETTTLVEATLGGPVGSVTARRLWAITRGNALYLRQLVDAELESSRLRQVAGVWQWTGKPELSPGLVELVRARIGQLPDAQCDVIEVLAFGEPLGVPLARRVGPHRRGSPLPCLRETRHLRPRRTSRPAPRRLTPRD